MLFIHFLRQERIDIRDGDRFKRPLSFKQSIEEWPHRTTVTFNRGRGKTSVFFHKASEFTQHPAADRYRFGYSLETVEKGEPPLYEGVGSVKRHLEFTSLGTCFFLPRRSFSLSCISTKARFLNLAVDSGSTNHLFGHRSSDHDSFFRRRDHSREQGAQSA